MISQIASQKEHWEGKGALGGWSMGREHWEGGA